MLGHCSTTLSGYMDTQNSLGFTMSITLHSNELQNNQQCGTKSSLPDIRHSNPLCHILILDFCSISFLHFILIFKLRWENQSEKTTRAEVFSHFWFVILRVLPHNHSIISFEINDFFAILLVKQLQGLLDLNLSKIFSLF